MPRSFYFSAGIYRVSRSHSGHFWKVSSGHGRALNGGGQSGLTCPLYLRELNDLWVQRWRQTKAKGDMIVVRFADDQIVGFENEHEAKAFLQICRKDCACSNWHCTRIIPG
jgi:hypothetical protein